MLESEKMEIRQYCLSEAQSWLQSKMKTVGGEPKAEDVLNVAKIYEDYVLDGKLPSD